MSHVMKNQGWIWSVGMARSRSSKVKVTQSCLSVCDPMDSPWNSPGQNTGVCSLSLLQGIFPTQGLTSGLLHCRQILHQLSQKGSPSPLCQKPFFDYSKENSPITLQCISQDRLGYVVVTNSSTFLLPLRRVIFLLT